MKRAISRRNFIKMFGLASGGIWLGCNFSEGTVINVLEDGVSFVPNLFVQLQKDGTLTIVVTRSEMGQGIRTSMASAIADELEADWKYVSIKQATGDAKFGDQNTDGSRSIRTLLTPMRKMGAMAKEMLLSAAAKKWKIATADCKAENHFVINKVTHEKLFYGDLVEAARDIEVNVENVKLKDKKDFKYIGKALKSFDIDDFIRGKAVYGMDIRLPGMKYAAIARCPVTFGTVKTFDEKDALAIKGVEDVVVLEKSSGPFGVLGGVAVVASNTWSAFQGKNNIKVEWNLGKNSSYDTTRFRKKIIERVHRPAKVTPGSTGNVFNAFSDAENVIEATYVIPHLVHTPMEVPNATAHVKDGTCEVWAPTQDPQTARTEIAANLGIDKKDVTVNVTFLGGGFGRKSKPDYVVEAAILSQKTNTPIQVIWSREDDIKHSYYHAISAQYLKGSIDKNGNVSGWLHRTAFPSIVSTFKPLSDYASGFELAQGFNNNPFQIPNVRLENAKAEAHVRIGWMRSVCNIHHSFGVNSFADELAVAAKKDPMQFKLDLIGKNRIIKGRSQYPFNSARLKNVINEVKRMSNWSKALPENYGMGVAFHYSFYSYVATVAEVSVIHNKLKIHHIYSVLDCGLYVNKDSVINQMEGAAVFGMSIVMYGKITAKDGAIEQNNFFDYQMARMEDVPKMEIVIIGNDETPTGVGEPGVPPIAPAITNAIFAATGKRIRSLPLSDHGLV
ncbi:MAG: molybdopterin-dependent oxidoreductase [Flavobacteriaceae bacterium]|nr:MAG: molybdopterin-dependent oxidoreductase [Flavobacteriaceae bacterium]